MWRVGGRGFCRRAPSGGEARSGPLRLSSVCRGHIPGAPVLQSRGQEDAGGSGLVLGSCAVSAGSLCFRSHGFSPA
eukprot:11200670-Lingulodinium_polyedra.AAC.1